MSKWIDCMDFGVGKIGYLVSSDNTNTRAFDVLRLHERPLRTNQSHEPRLYGWCGETNNVSRTAKGVWKVVRTNAAKDRVQIRELTGAERAAFLYADGHSDLIPEADRGALVIVGLLGGDASDAKAAVCIDLDRGQVTNGEEWAALVRGPEAWDGAAFGDGNGGTVERAKDGTITGPGLYAPALAA